MAIAYEISHRESILRIQMNPGREGNRAVLIPSCFEVAWLAGSCVNCPKWKHKMDVFGDVTLSLCGRCFNPFVIWTVTSLREVTFPRSLSNSSER